MKSARRIIDRDLKPSNAATDVELVWNEDDDARADRRFVELVRRIRDKHRARAGQRGHSPERTR